MDSYYTWTARQTGADRRIEDMPLDRIATIIREALRDLQAADLAQAVRK